MNVTDFETKANEFKKAFRSAVLNRELEYTVSWPVTSGYIGKLEFNIKNMETWKTSMSVAENFICYHSPILEDAFEKEDIPKLIDMINEYKFEMKKQRISELEKELEQLKTAV